MNHQPNKGIFITVRTASTRLPQKALLDVDGVPTIEYVIQRQKHSEKANQIVLCTTTEPEDEILVDIANRNNIEVYRGSVQDKLARWLGAAKKFDIEHIVTVDGDDLFCEPELVDLAFEQLERNNVDFIQSTGIACGAFTYGFRTAALEKVCEIKDTDDTEMMWVYFTETGLFNVEELENVPKAYFRDDVRMTLDYTEDLRFFKEVVDSCKNSATQGKYPHLQQILQIIDKQPALKEINFFRQEEFKSNQSQKTQLKIKTEK